MIAKLRSLFLALDQFLTGSEWSAADVAEQDYFVKPAPQPRAPRVQPTEGWSQLPITAAPVFNKEEEKNTWRLAYSPDQIKKAGKELGSVLETLTEKEVQELLARNKVVTIDEAMFYKPLWLKGFTADQMKAAYPEGLCKRHIQDLVAAFNAARNASRPSPNRKARAKKEQRTHAKRTQPEAID